MVKTGRSPLWVRPYFTPCGTIWHAYLIEFFGNLIMFAEVKIPIYIVSPITAAIRCGENLI